MKFVCCLLLLVYTYEYVIYHMHILLKIPYYFFVLTYSGGFRVSGINRIWFQAQCGLSPEPVFAVVLGFEFGFRVWVHEGSTRSEFAPLPSLAGNWELWQRWRACDAMEEE